ncbi:hypothetical protein, partial [Microcoleus sp. CAWBG640]|uniref:hypothetical protein n=1 Tax=Microcoleus sp. CAWBG640 TaxID=2841653 RepID=UPI00312B7C73
VLVDQPLKPLLKRWFRELSPLKGSTPETKRGKGLELLEMSIQSKAITAKYTELGVSYQQQLSLSASLDKQLAIQVSQKEAYWKGEPVGSASASASRIGGFFSNLFGKK